MYIVQVSVKESSIDGKGVFALQNIKKGDMVWRFDPSHDKSIGREEFDALDKDKKIALQRVAYLSKSTGRLIYPPENDPALYTNHSTTNNLSAILNQAVSEEPIFIANRDIVVGEELTNNYKEFDDLVENLQEKWMN